MLLGGYDRHLQGGTGPWARLGCLLALAVIWFSEPGDARQQSSPTGQGARPSSKLAPPFAESQKLLHEGRVEEAKGRILEELKQHPTSAEGYILLGLACTQTKNYDEAFDAFEHARKLNPKSVRVRNNLGNLYIAEEKPDEAEGEFRQALRLNPADHDGNYNLGLVLLAKKQPAEAIRYLLRVQPQDLASRFNLTRAYLEAGRTREALRTAEELSALDKDNVQVHFTLGVLLASEKQHRAAQAELEQANALQPNTFEILHNLGGVYLRNEEYSRAELVLNRALTLKPDSPETLYLLAQVDSEHHKPADALDLLARAHKLAPANADITFLFARVCMSENYYEDAIPLLESALGTSPERADLRAALGESYFMSGKVEKAIAEFKQLIALDPAARSYAFMGLSYRQLGRFDEARKYFEEGLKKDPRNTACLFNMGYIEEHQGHHAAAEHFFQEALGSSPDYPEALLELANLRIAGKRFAEAADLLRKYVRVSHAPASGYYKLAMVERSLQQTKAAERDMSVFQTLSKNASTGPYPYQHLFDYLDNRSTLSSREKTMLDLTQLLEQIRTHPGQPEDLYLLAEGYLKLGQVEDARKAVAQLDQLSTSDYRTQTGVGVLLARYRLYDDAIQHFENALRTNPDSDDVKFDLADAYFRNGLYPQALGIAQQVSANGGQDDAFLALLGDIKAHLGQTEEASQIFKTAIRRNPDNDQYYLSLTLLQFRKNDLTDAEKTLQEGLARNPGSGKLLWGRGLLSVLDGKTAQAGEQFEQAVDLLPEWSGSYCMLGVFYYVTGQIDKAREVLKRFEGSNAGGGLDVHRIQEVLERASAIEVIVNQPLPSEARQQLLEFAVTIVDRTL